MAGVAVEGGAGAFEGRVDRPAMGARIVRVRKRRALPIRRHRDQRQSTNTAINIKTINATCRVHSNANVNQYIKMVHTLYIGHTYSDA